MGIINHMTQPQLPAMVRQIRSLNNAAPLNNGAIGRDGLLVYDGGAVTFANGAQVFTNADSVQLFNGNGVVQVDGTGVTVQWGGNALRVDSTGVRLLKAPTTTAKANLYIDTTTGKLSRSTAP